MAAHGPTRVDARTAGGALQAPDDSCARVAHRRNADGARTALPREARHRRGIRKQDVHALTIVVVLFVIAGLLNLGTSAAQTYFTGWTGERILADLRNTLFRHLQRLSLGYYERNRAGVIISRLTNDVEALDQLVTDGVTTLIQSTLFSFGTSIILFFLDWRLALGDADCDAAHVRRHRDLPVRSARAYLGGPRAARASSPRPSPRTSAACRRVVQAFRREQANQRNFQEVNAHYREANQQTVVLNGPHFPFVDFLSALATAIVIGYGGYLVFGGSLTESARCSPSSCTFEFF